MASTTAEAVSRVFQAAHELTAELLPRLAEAALHGGARLRPAHTSMPARRRPAQPREHMDSRSVRRMALPGGSGALGVKLEIHEGVRRAETALVELLTGEAGFRRGPSDAATAAAIRSIAEMIATAHLEHLGTAPEVTEASAYLRHAAARARAVLGLDDRPEDDRPTPAPSGVAPCGCGMRMVLPRSWVTASTAPVLWCPRCSSSVAPAVWMRGLPIAAELATAQEAAARLGLRAGTVRQWAARGRLKPAGLSETGADVYELDAVRCLAASAQVTALEPAAA